MLCSPDSIGERLAAITYAGLTDNQILGSNKMDGKTVVCISICSDNYKPEPVPETAAAADAKKARECLAQDPVYRFHTKPKGGFEKGAELISLIPNARPEDKRALGYNMLMKYPEIKKQSRVKIRGSESVATQLMEAVMVFAQQLGIKDVYVFSRPIGVLPPTEN